MENRQKIITSFRLKRIGAFIIDAIIVSIILSIVYRITGLPNFPGVLANMIELQKSTASQDVAVKVMALFNEAFLQSLIIYFCYDVVTTLLLRGSTIGKKIFRLKLTRMNNKKGKLPYILLVIVRSFFKFLTMFIFQGFPFFLSVISMFANKKSLAVHDRIGRFVVINKNE
ncbi:RDD family protein [Bacillus sp. AFS017336]|uniref:RDD family protein n=1 Tax=Bacillus sp. AFS017336 TaxID=2033489 RepID=UPI000BEFE90E|nr:RDD family protein [Bacillus sp. AFS017336]PEL05847.1 transporter [Bacillus sp. AFS017336]